MPASFEFASPWMRTNSCQLWLPLQLQRGQGERGSHWMCAVGRLKDGVSLAAADAEIKAIGARLKAAYPETNAQKPFLVRSLYEEMTRYTASRVWMLFGAVALVLLVACANVASMLLARNARRQGEFGSGSRSEPPADISSVLPSLKACCLPYLERWPASASPSAVSACCRPSLRPATPAKPR